MSDIPPLSVKVIVDSSGVAKGVQVANQGLDQIVARTSKVSAAFGNLKATMFGVLGGNLLTTGVMAIGHELNAMKQETIDLQQQTIRLNQALSGVGITSEKVQKDVFNAADSFYQLGFQGSEAISAMGTLVTATGNVSQAQKLMAMSADLARYKHIDMESAAKILARGTQGSAKAFKELGITLDTTIPKNQAISQAFDELNKKIGGQAQAYTKSFAGQMAVLKERMDNLFQAIGSRVLPVLAALVGYITTNGKALLIYGGIVLSIIAIIKTYSMTLTAVKAVQQAYAFWTYAQAASTNVFRFALSALFTTMKANPIGFIIAGVMALGVAFVWAWNKFEGFRKAIITGMQIILNTVGYLIGGISTLLKAMSYLPGMGKLKDVAKGVDGIAKSVRDYSNGLDKLADKKISTPKIPGIVTPGSPTGIQGNVPGGGAKVGGSKTGGGSNNTIVQNVVVYATNTNDISKNVSKIAKNGMPIGAK